MMTAMPKPTVVARLLEGDRLQCQISSPWGLTLTLAGSTTDVEPEVIEGAEQLSGNRARCLHPFCSALILVRWDHS